MELTFAEWGALNQFYAREYASAENSVLSQGITSLRNDQKTIEDIVNQHVNHYRSKPNLRDRVHVMTLYLTEHLQKKS